MANNFLLIVCCFTLLLTFSKVHCVAGPDQHEVNSAVLQITPISAVVQASPSNDINSLPDPNPTVSSSAPVAPNLVTSDPSLTFRQLPIQVSSSDPEIPRSAPASDPEIPRSAPEASSPVLTAPNAAPEVTRHASAVSSPAPSDRSYATGLAGWYPAGVGGLVGQNDAMVQGWPGSCPPCWYWLVGQMPRWCPKCNPSWPWLCWMCRWFSSFWWCSYCA